MGEGRRGVFSQGGGGLPNWWLDSEEQWAGFWLGGEGHLPGLTPPPEFPSPQADWWPRHSPEARLLCSRDAEPEGETG